MWIDTQKWRKSFKVDELYETFDYTEKAQVDQLYPRYAQTPSSLWRYDEKWELTGRCIRCRFYHKVDKVRTEAAPLRSLRHRHRHQAAD